MFRLVYLSEESSRFTSEWLEQLAAHAAVKNAQLCITGLLLYAQGNFLQILEGEEAAVRPLFRVIERDRRHHRVVSLLEESIATRSFPDWGMGFRNLSKAPEAGGADFLEHLASLQSPQDESLRRVLRLFSDLTAT